MHSALIVHTPARSPAQLILLAHACSADAKSLLIAGQRLAGAFPEALIVSLDAPTPAVSGVGRQWFSLHEISEDNRPGRVAAAMPDFLAMIRRWQRDSGVAAAATALVGFSQGAIMALEATTGDALVAGRVVAIGGRFARLPQRPAPATTVHLIHGKADPVIPYRHSIAAAERMIRLGTDATADVLPFVGHEINDEVLQLLLTRLTSYVPLRLWQEALSGRADGTADAR